MKPERRRRIAGLILLLGVGLALFTLSPHQRHENTLIFRFDPDLSERVRRLNATYTPVGDVDASGGFTLDFAHGPGREVRKVILVPTGDYVISLQLEPPDVARELSETSLQRRVTLSGTDVIIPLGRRSPD